MDDKTYIAVLEGRVDQLEDRVRELTSMLAEPALVHWPEEWGLTRTESLMLLCLRSGETVARQDIVRSMYPDRIAPPDAKILDVLSCKIRKKIHPFGKTVENVWGVGLRLTDLPQSDTPINEAQELTQ